jgi:hypothetical protein
MLHLFKETYLNQDSNINIKYNRIVISNDNGYPSAGDPAKLLAYGKTVEDVIGQGKQFANFLDLLVFLDNKQTEVGNSQIQIYADRTAYIKLSAYWLKVLFANGTADSAYDFLKCNLSKINLSVIDRTSTELVVDITREEFTLAYNAIVDNFESYNTFMTNILQELSIEVLVASYLANNSVKSQLANKLYLLELSEISGVCLGVKTSLFDSVLRANFRAVSGANKPTIDNLESIVNDSAFDLFFTLYNSVKDNNVASLSDELIDQIQENIELLTTEIFGVPNLTNVSFSRVALLKHLKGTSLSDEGFDSVMTYEINSHFSFLSSVNSAFNTLFINFIVDQYRSNTQGTVVLTPYIIRGSV